MKKLVIVNGEQFGYNNATYYYCEYLKNKFDITYIGWDHGFNRIDMDGVKVINIKRGFAPVRVFRFLESVWKETKSNKTIIVVKYFKIITTLLRIIRIFNPMVLDIRTGSVSKSKIKRRVDDFILWIESLGYSNVTVISSGVKQKLHLARNSMVLPLGADVISAEQKKFEDLRLVYVGTLHHCNIDVLIDGVALYCSKYKQ